MESKLNALAIETYNTAFSNRVINNFFARHEKINGEQILQLSPVPQVNLFVIKNLFTTWQREAASMRSPYFNYQHPKVQEAQKTYMNTLSRHIAISEENLKPLLQQAVHDTLLLLFYPVDFLGKALQLSSATPQEINEILRYIKINQAYAQEAKHILNQQDITDSQWLNKLEEELEKLEAEGRLKPESPAPYMEQFSQVLPLKPSEILYDEELKAKSAEEDEDSDFFSSLSGRLEKEEQKQEPIQERQQDTPIQQTQAAPAPDENIPTVTDAAHRHAQLRRDEPELSNKKPEIRISSPESAEERQNRTLNDRLGKEYKSLNEKLTASAVREEKQPAAPLHPFKKQASIRSAIGLNHRFMFTNELFNGDSQAFNQALDELEGFENYQQAYQHTLRNYARSYNWDMESEASQEFIDILKSRYA
jgi:hypothetical protein